jgi:signal transduction histidine kinase
VFHGQATTERQLLETLERLIEIPFGNLRSALNSAADLVAAALRADKVDTFLYDAARDSLVAVGASNQPLSELERKHGLDVLPIANGGRVVDVFQKGATFVTGRLDADPEELRGVREVLRIRSKLGVPLETAGVRRGVMMIASERPDHFTADDVRFAESVARWVGNVAHRIELVDESARNGAEQGRRAVAEELITVLAHDLRNHLSPIDLRLKVLRRRADREERAADLRDLDLALRGLDRFRGMISDILDVARIDQGVLKIEPAPTDLVAVLRDVAGGLATPQQPIDVEAPDELLAVADEQRVRQAVENLLSNAIKHSPKEAPVTVIVRRTSAEAGICSAIDVIDHGPGVPPDVLPRIFDRFVSGRQHDGGLGLGLYLAKRIALLHGGDLTVESTPGTGARFTLSLPCDPE